MSETQLLNSTNDTSPDFTSSHISTSWSHLPVKFTCCDADQEELDDSSFPVEGASGDGFSQHVRNQFGSDTSEPLSASSPLGLDGVKSNLRNSLASIPNHLSVEYSNNRQSSNSTKSVSPDCSTTSLLRTSKTSSSVLTMMNTSKQHNNNTNVSDDSGVIDKIPSLGVRSNSNLTISSWSTVQSRHTGKSSPTQLSALSNQNVFKSSTRASSRRLASLYNTI
ncbi:unnamed protein product [Trichobilharzia szidati]|nr:unnamed protein product [Trichobilharzia szidati]